MEDDCYADALRSASARRQRRDGESCGLSGKRFEVINLLPSSMLEIRTTLVERG